MHFFHLLLQVHKLSDIQSQLLSRLPTWKSPSVGVALQSCIHPLSQSLQLHSWIVYLKIGSTAGALVSEPNICIRTTHLRLLLATSTSRPASWKYLFDVPSAKVRGKIGRRLRNNATDCNCEWCVQSSLQMTCISSTLTLWLKVSRDGRLTCSHGTKAISHVDHHDMSWRAVKITFHQLYSYAKWFN